MDTQKDLEEFIKQIPPNESGFLNKTFIDMIKNAEIFNISSERLKILIEQYYDYSIIMMELI